MSLESWKSFFEFSSVILLFLTFVFGAGVVFTASKINARQKLELLRMEKDLADAKTGLAAQEERAARAEADLTRLKGAVAGAEGKVEDMRKQNLATEGKLEAEKLERARLEAQVAPRRLSAAQRTALALACSKFRGRLIRVASYSLDVEGGVLATQIIASLKSANVSVDDAVAAEMPFGQFRLGIHVSGKDAELTEGLRAALEAQGLAASSSKEPPPSGPIVRAGPQGAQEPSATILVGAKPPKQ